MALVSGEHVYAQSAIVYTRNQLLALGSSAVLPTAQREGRDKEEVPASDSVYYHGEGDVSPQ